MSQPTLIKTLWRTVYDRVIDPAEPSPYTYRASSCAKSAVAIICLIAGLATAFALLTLVTFAPEQAAAQAPAGSAQTSSAVAPLAGKAAAVRPIEITARRIRSFDRSGTKEERFANLVFRGGLVLTSSAKPFGGLSGIAIEADGHRFMAVSDEGNWLSGDIVYEGTAPAAIKNAHMGPYLAIAGRTLDRKRDNDAEAISLADGNLSRGAVLIGFERNHRIGRFPVIDGILMAPTAYLKLPPEARRMRSNKGFEAVAVMQGGPYKGSPVAFSERFPDNPEQHTGWIWLKGEPQRLALQDIDGFDVTDAASLADGSLLVLERRFRWSEWTQGVRMRLRRIAASELKPGLVMHGEKLLEADLSKEIDNMEGLAVHRSQAGETVLTIISDDNFNSFLQRTLLLQFTLLDQGTTAERTPTP